jgi:hypothetical protein
MLALPAGFILSVCGLACLIPIIDAGQDRSPIVSREIAIALIIAGGLISLIGILGSNWLSLDDLKASRSVIAVIALSS